METNGSNKCLYGKDGGIAFSLAITLYVLITFLGQTVFGALLGSQSVAYLAVCATFAPVAMIITIVLFCNRKECSFKIILTLKPFNLISILSAALLAVGMFFGLGCVNGLISTALEDLGATVVTPTVPLSNFGQFILFTFVLAVVPAVVEELFFRGLILSSLKNYSVAAAVVISSLCFSMYHGSVSQLAYQFAFGVGFSLLALYSGSVLPCVAVHFINNFFVLLCEYLGIYINLLNPVLIAVGILSLVIFSLIVVAGLKNKKACVGKKGAFKDYFLPYGLVGVAICLILIVGGMML